MQRLTLERSLHVLAPVLGRKRGVDVVIGGTAMATDGKTVFLPALPPDDTEAAIIGFGGLFHETNHIRYTDFSVTKPAGFLGELLNVIEDIRIDRLGHLEYPGGRLEEDLLVDTLIKRGEAKHSCAGDHPAAILESYVMWRLESEVLGITSAAPLALTSEALARATFPSETMAKLDAMMFEVLQCQSTADCLALAERMVAMIEVDASQQENCSIPAGSQSSLLEVLCAGDGDHATSLGDLVSAALEQKAVESSSESMSLPSAELQSATSSHHATSSFSDDVRASANALIQRIAGLLQAQTMTRFAPSFSGRRIDARRLYRLPMGDTRLFRRRTVGERADTVIQICLDRSGSMDGSDIEIARAACFACALAMQSFQGVSVAVAAFPGVESDVVQVTSFDERVERCAARFCALDASGGTPMVEAMLWAACELLRQRRPRRLLLLVTDGQYDGSRGQHMVASLRAAGIETIGIGIGCAVSHLFERSRAIAHIADLPSAMFSLLLDALKTRPGR
jgi:cobaltochelatase CobT